MRLSILLACVLPMLVPADPVYYETILSGTVTVAQDEPWQLPIRINAVTQGGPLSAFFDDGDNSWAFYQAPSPTTYNLSTTFDDGAGTFMQGGTTYAFSPDVLSPSNGSIDSPDTFTSTPLTPLTVTLPFTFSLDVLPNSSETEYVFTGSGTATITLDYINGGIEQEGYGTFVFASAPEPRGLCLIFAGSTLLFAARAIVGRKRKTRARLFT